MEKSDAERTTTLIIQARMGSERLPGKVLKKVLDRPLLDFLLERAKRVKNITSLVVATSKHPKDDEIAAFCEEKSISIFRGEEEDVLSRFLFCAREFGGEAIVRITGDCPLLDPHLIEEVIQFYWDHFPRYDYVSNTLKRSYPRGMDVEVFSMETLEKTHLEAKSPSEREHVTLHMYQNPQIYKLGSFEGGSGKKDLRLTVDTQEDFILVKRILETLYPLNPLFSLEDILQLMEKQADWAKINAHVTQKKVN